ncbi:MAG TPA: hypothetical protein VLX68_08145 [Chitinivibrionales bacterium]|nr:hypothetical protein [Chitinivibrionales bacterium]
MHRPLLPKFHPSLSFLFLFIILAVTSFASQTGHPLNPDMLGNKSFTEYYTLTAMHGDRLFVQVQLTFTNLGVENNNAACKALVLKPGATSWKVNEKFSRKEWNYSEQGASTLSVGTNTLSVCGGNTCLFAKLGKGTVKIKLHGVPAAMKTPNLDFPKNESGKFYDYEILVPWTSLETSLDVPGFPKQDLNGFGMLEVAKSVGTSRDVCRGWVTFRGFEGDSFFLADFRLPPEEKLPAAGWIWKNGQEKPLAMTGLHIRKEWLSVDGKQVEGRVISALDNSFIITGRDLLYRYSFVDELGAFTGYLVKVVIGKPITRYYDAEVRFAGEARPLHGVLELMSIE